MGANANGWHGAPIAAAQLANEEATTSGLGEESNKEWLPRTPVPFAQFGQLRPKTLIAALRRLAGYPTRRSRSTLRCTFSALQRVCVHSVNWP
jgi:hypothetical protein